MADISKLSRLINGAQRNVDMLSNTLLTQNVKIGGAVNYLTFDVSAVVGVRTITMPDANVNLGDMLSKTLASGQIYIGSAGGVATAQTLSGDVTVSNTGVTTIGASKVVTSMINNAAVDENKLAASVAGAGLAGGAGTALSVNVDNSTIEIPTDTLQVKDLGITGSKIANLTITDGKISASAAISFAKMAALTANRVLLSDNSGVVVASSITDTTLGYLDATSSIQTQLNAKLSLSGGTMTGNILMGSNKITSSYVPLNGVDLVNKTYVDNVASGNSWKQAVNAFNLLGNASVATINGLTPAEHDQYVVTDAGTLTTGSLAVVAGDIVEFKAAVWIKIESGVGGFVANGIRAILAGFSGTVGAPYTNATDQDKIVSFDGTSLTGVITGDTVDKASILIQDSGSISFFDNAAYVYEGTAPSGQWLQFNGAGQIAAGIGLTKTGNTLDINLGAGIKELPTDEVGIDVHTNGGLFTTVDNSTSSTVTGAQLAIKLDGSTLSKSALGLKVADSGITVTQLANDAVETLKIKDLNVTTNKLANAAVDETKLASSVAGAGLSGGAGAALSVNVDNTTIEIPSDTLQVKDSGISTAKIAANAVTGAKIRLANNETLRGRNAANTADVDILKVNASDKVEMSSFFETPASAPTTDYQVANKKYVDDKTVPGVFKTFTIGENLGANTTYALRMSVNGETAGSLYKADLDATVADKWHVVALITTDGSGISAGNTAVCTMIGEIASSVTFAGADIGQPVYLGASGVVTTSASTTSGYACFKLGVVSATGVGTSKILVSNMQLMGIA